MIVQFPKGPPGPPTKPLKAANDNRASWSNDSVTCLECECVRPMKMLKRHLAADHGMTPAEYRKKHCLPPHAPMVARNYALMRRALAYSARRGDEALEEEIWSW